MSVKKYDLTKDGEKSLSNVMNLKVKEFRSYSGTKRKLYTNEVLISTELVDKIGKLYQNMNCSKIVINSGYRCAAHNKAIGGASNSQHLYGTAADVVFFDFKGNNINPKYVCCMAQNVGFSGIGRMSTATHLDVRTGSKWYGDETKRETSGGYYSLSKRGIDFFSYFGLTKNQVENLFKKEEKPKTEPPKTEDNDMEELKKLLSSKVSINFNGELKELDGFIKDGTTYIKLRPFLESIGYKVDFDSKTKTIEVTR